MEGQKAAAAMGGGGNADKRRRLGGMDGYTFSRREGEKDGEMCMARRKLKEQLMDVSLLGKVGG